MMVVVSMAVSVDTMTEGIMPHMSTEGKPVAVVDEMDRRLLRIEEIAERLAVSRSMAWKIIALGQLRSVRIGRAVRVRPHDLEGYLADAARER
jgi:excisionase family DNA binding protein